MDCQGALENVRQNGKGLWRKSKLLTGRDIDRDQRLLA